MNLGIENEFVEFKESLSQLDKGLKSITAMLNRQGYGRVYFGVNDQGDVIGTTVGKKTFEDIRNIIRNTIEPRIVINLFERSTDDGKIYVELYAEGADMPYSYDGRYFIRNISSDESVSNDLLRKMLISSNSDLIKNITSENQKLTFTAFCNFLSSMGLYAPQRKEFLESKGFFNKEKKFNLLAYLLSDQSEMSIKVVKFEGVDKTFMSSRTEYGKKCLLNSVVDVLNYFNSINTVLVDLSEGVRKEIHLFEYEAFKEAWINACLHTSWANMIPPSIFIYDNRIEILSYGSLPYNLSLESFFEGVSMPVNLSLLSIFNVVKLSEQSGHGIPKIVKSYSKEAFLFEDGTVKVTLKYNFEPDFVKFKNSKQNIINGLNKNQKNVYYYLSEHSKAKFQEVASDLQLSIQGVKKIVVKLQQLNLIERIGPKNDATWKIK